jgi:hypothetical protein
MKLNKILTIFLIPIIFLSACNLPSAGGPDAAGTLQAIYTAQAATLQALQTQAASGVTQLPPTIQLPTLPPLPTLTPMPPLNTLPALPASQAPASRPCDAAEFVKDITIPDGTIIGAEAAFTKTWRIRNTGTCSWNTAYALAFVSGSKLDGPAALNLPGIVAPGQTVDISVPLKAPNSSGTYRGNWMLRNAAGVLFGIGAQAQNPFYVEIKVNASMFSIYDFAANYCTADWRSAGGDLGCPGNPNGKKGFVLKVDKPQLENGSVDNRPGLLTVPQYQKNGYLSGYYPAFSVQKGDRFRALINCEYKSNGCNVIFKLEYKIGSGAIQTLWQFVEAYEGQYYNVDVDLSSLAGKDVKFILTVESNGDWENDRPIWVAPRIERPASKIPPSKTPTPTSTNTIAPITPTYTPTSSPTTTVTVTNTVTPSPTETPTSTPTVTETPTP